jgi:hypothetical protein
MSKAARRPGGGDRLGLRALGRATLERQWLLQRRRSSIPAALEHLVGLQAQATDPPYVALWTRLADFAFQDLDRLALRRSVVRCALMRSTLHLVTSRDALRLRPILQPVQDRALAATHGRHLIGLNLAEVAAATRAILAEGPMTYQDLGQRLRARWPERDADALANTARNVEALVQAPPALWGGGARTRVAHMSEWLAKPLGTEAEPEPLILRYLAAYGPASVADIRAWSGLAGISEVVETLRPSLRVFKSEAGVELFDLPRAPRPDPDTPAPVRLLGGFDGLILGFADRSRFLDDTHRRRIATANGIFHPLILIDGRVAGTWKLAIAKHVARVELTPFASLQPEQRADLTREAEALLATAIPDRSGHEVQFKPIK